MAFNPVENLNFYNWVSIVTMNYFEFLASWLSQNKKQLSSLSYSDLQLTEIRCF